MWIFTRGAWEVGRATPGRQVRDAKQQVLNLGNYKGLRMACVIDTKTWQRSCMRKEVGKVQG